MFFKTDNPEIVAAFNKYHADKSALHAAAEAFAKEYDAEPIVLGGRDGAHFAGIVFKRSVNINCDVWRKPNRQHFNISSLRVRATKKEFKDEFELEKKKYDDLSSKHFPNGERISFEPFLKTLGLSSGDLFFNGFACFAFDDHLYLDTTLKLKEVTEILGSEYQAADAERKASDVKS